MDNEFLAKKYFHGQEGYNCAQAVLAGSRELHNIGGDKISEAQAWGGGRSPNGYCGALYALLTLIPEDKHQIAVDKFKERIGAIRCKEIRPAGLAPCQSCVAVALDILNEFIP